MTFTIRAKAKLHFPRIRHFPHDNLTLHKCVEGSGCREVGGNGDVLFVGALGLHSHGAVGIGAVAAYPSCGVGHVCQPPVVVIPAKQKRIWRVRRETNEEPI